MTEYIHYGDSNFDPGLCTRDVHSHHAKPNKGIWASPVDAEFGWKDWCESEQWCPKGFNWKKSFIFTLTEEAKILYIHTEDDILDYIIKDPDDWNIFNTKTSVSDSLNLEKLYNEFDGMELFMSENYVSLHYSIFNSWDCDSIVVWNPKVINVIRSENH